MDEIEKDKFVEINKKGNIGTFVYIPSNYPGPIAIDATINQPERSKREDINKKDPGYKYNNSDVSDIYL